MRSARERYTAGSRPGRSTTVLHIAMQDDVVVLAAQPSLWHMKQLLCRKHLTRVRPCRRRCEPGATSCTSRSRLLVRCIHRSRNDARRKRDLEEAVPVEARYHERRTGRPPSAMSYTVQNLWAKKSPCQASPAPPLTSSYCQPGAVAVIARPPGANSTRSLCTIAQCICHLLIMKSGRSLIASLQRELGERVRQESVCLRTSAGLSVLHTRTNAWPAWLNMMQSWQRIA